MRLDRLGHGPLMLRRRLDDPLLLRRHGIQCRRHRRKLLLQPGDVGLQTLILLRQGITFLGIRRRRLGSIRGAGGQLRREHTDLRRQGVLGLDLLLELGLQHGRVGLMGGRLAFRLGDPIFEIVSLLVGEFVDFLLDFVLLVQGDFVFGRFRLGGLGAFFERGVGFFEFGVDGLEVGFGFFHLLGGMGELLVEVGDFGGEESLGVGPGGELRFEGVDVVDEDLGCFLRLGEFGLQFLDFLGVFDLEGFEAEFGRFEFVEIGFGKVVVGGEVALAVLGRVIGHQGHGARGVVVRSGVFLGGRVGDGVVGGSPFEGADVSVAIGVAALLGQHHGNAALAILHFHALGVGHEEEIDHLFLAAVAEGEMEGQHALIVLAGRSLREGHQEGAHGLLRGLEDDGGVEGEEAPAQLAVGFFAGDPGGGFVGVGAGAFGGGLPVFLLDGDVELRGVDVVVAFGSLAGAVARDGHDGWSVR
mmetsp:Transcript_17968/g.36592  ORF Transcript_17968/g.36592 Transcript_17968/m.36592 type:complete len:472 (+) Transcript_17968:409-1824(+)